MVNTWRPVCDSYLHPNVSIVLCRMLGLPTNNVTLKSNKFTGNWDRWIRCNAEDQSILDDCLWQIWPDNDCPAVDRMGISCNGNIRLVDGINTENGNIEVFLNETFTSICDLHPDNNVARVVCRQMGFAIERSALTINSYFGQGHAGNHRVTCIGNETSIEQCQYHRLPENSTCSPDSVLGVDCNATQYEIYMVRKFPGGMSVRFNTYGVAAYWTENVTAADNGTMLEMKKIVSVICHELGYSRYDPDLFEIPLQEYVTYPTQLSGVFTCSGFEERLSECAVGGDPDYLDYFADNATEIAIGCKDVLQLRDGETPHSGILMQRNDIDGTWKPLADIRPDYPMALVACRQLGYNSSYVEIRLMEKGDDDVSPLSVAYVCSGEEAILRHCQKSLSHDRQSDSVVALDCAANGMALSEKSNSTTEGSKPERRLYGKVVGGQGDTSWSSFCHSGTSVDSNTAGVICHQLGYARTDAEVTEGSAIGNSAVVDDLARYSCVGSEESIDQCPRYGNFSRENCKFYVNISCKDLRRCMDTDVKMPSMTINCHIIYCVEGVCQYGDISGHKEPCSLDKGKGCMILKTYTRGPFFISQQNVIAACQPCTPHFSEDAYHYRSQECCYKDMCNANTTVVRKNRSFRLVDGISHWEGYVQFYSKSEDKWTYVLDHSSVADIDLETICAGCGYFATIISRSPNEGNEKPSDDTCFIPGSAPAYFRNCNIQDLTSGCFLTKIACTEKARLRINCNARAPETRLVDGGDAHKGRVEIFFSDRWGTICTRGINKGVSDVICRSLGFARGCSQNTTSDGYRARFPRGDGSIHFENVSCVGNEISILKCNFSFVGEDSECSHNDDLGIICEDGVTVDASNVPDTENEYIDDNKADNPTTTPIFTSSTWNTTELTADFKTISCFKGLCETKDCRDIPISIQQFSRCITTKPAFCYVEKQETKRNSMVRYSFGCSLKCSTGVTRITVGQINTRYCCASELCNVNGDGYIDNITDVVDENVNNENAADNFTGFLEAPQNTISVSLYNTSVENVSAHIMSATSCVQFIIILIACLFTCF